MDAKEGFVPEVNFARSSPPFHIVCSPVVITTIVFFPVRLDSSVLHCVTQCTHNQSANYTT